MTSQLELITELSHRLVLYICSNKKSDFQGRFFCFYLFSASAAAAVAATLIVAMTAAASAAEVGFCQFADI